MNRWLSIPGVLAVAVVAAATFAISYQALAEVSVAFGVAPWVVPVCLDGGILALGLFRADLVRQKRSAWGAVLLMLAATSASSAVNVSVHSAKGDLLLFVILAGAVPFFFWGLTEEMIRSVFPKAPAERKPRPVKRQTAAQTATASTSPVVEAPKPRPVARPVVPRVPIEAASREAAALLTEFDTLVNSEAVRDPNGSPESERLSTVVLELVDEHAISATDLARRAGHDSPSKLRARLTKARKKADRQDAPALVDA